MRSISDGERTRRRVRRLLQGFESVEDPAIGLVGIHSTDPVSVHLAARGAAAAVSDVDPSTALDSYVGDVRDTPRFATPLDRELRA